MAAKGWLLGCGTILVVGVLALIGTGAYLRQRVGEMREGVEDAQQRYQEINRDFPFTPPAGGALNTQRFDAYLQVRRTVESAIVPLQERSGLGRLLALAGIPEELSRAQADALREQSMSLNEYVWISRQIYTAIMAEAAREDGDAGLKRLQNDLDNALRRQNGNRVRVGVGANPNPLAGGTNESRLLDYHWLQVPAATRDIVRQHETELSQTMDAAVADSLLLNVNR